MPRPLIGRCQGRRSSIGVAPLRVLAARYLVIAVAGNRSLDRDFDRLEGADHERLAAARADLHDAARTERLFDRDLLRIVFTPALEATAGALATSNESRARLTAKAADSASLRQLREYEQQLSAANGPVERQVGILRSQLGLPPPETD